MARTVGRAVSFCGKNNYNISLKGIRLLYNYIPINKLREINQQRHGECACQPPQIHSITITTCHIHSIKAKI